MKYIEDSELGIIKLQANVRAKRFVARYRDGEFLLTYPSFVSDKEIKVAINQMRDRLLQMKSKSSVQFVFDENTSFSTLTFRLEVKSNTLNNIYTSLKDGILSISYPKSVNLADENFQTQIKETIENACRKEANRIFLNRVSELAKIHNFIVGTVKINKSRSRWGSCSSKKNINLSYFCMMLPEHLVDFIILHELCHTVEMNHGPRFWALLDSVSNNRAKALTQELKNTKLKW